MINKRMCAGCMERKHKSELIRIVRAIDGEIKHDLTCKIDGRGIYICKNQKCLDITMRKKSIKRSLKADVDENFVAYLKEYITKQE